MSTKKIETALNPYDCCFICKRKRSDRIINVFEKFKNISSVQDSPTCIEITGWTKKQFLDFSKFITSIKNSKNRSKEQLIALYRYWLRTGINQSECSQQAISKYLSQIRKAINDDFVPFFFGPKEKENFF
ncbi:hypothetical protein BpHYR1_005434 [Brachionus plicatilis]|uniref:Uncharacterized protein n=1 Tax=Brachionus plicatilis TaxID=10195 RepID=A0A3M7Q354_BRAPC|nr:hypothetical protein BpHYR1_005434 [Brachionus plicatilis]